MAVRKREKIVKSSKGSLSYFNSYNVFSDRKSKDTNITFTWEDVKDEAVLVGKTKDGDIYYVPASLVEKTRQDVNWERRTAKNEYIKLIIEESDGYFINSPSEFMGAITTPETIKYLSNYPEKELDLGNLRESLSFKNQAPLEGITEDELWDRQTEKSLNPTLKGNFKVSGMEASYAFLLSKNKEILKIKKVLSTQNMNLHIYNQSDVLNEEYYDMPANALIRTVSYVSNGCPKNSDMCDLFGFAVDLDGVGRKEMRNLYRSINMGIIPKPTVIQNSGNGLHLFYALTDPVAIGKSLVSTVEGEFKKPNTVYSVCNMIEKLIYSILAIPGITHNKDVRIKSHPVTQGYKAPGCKCKDGTPVFSGTTGVFYSQDELISIIEASVRRLVCVSKRMETFSYLSFEEAFFEEDFLNISYFDYKDFEKDYNYLIKKGLICSEFKLTEKDQISLLFDTHFRRVLKFHPEKYKADNENMIPNNEREYDIPDNIKYLKEIYAERTAKMYPNGKQKKHRERRYHNPVKFWSFLDKIAELCEAGFLYEGNRYFLCRQLAKYGKACNLSMSLVIEAFSFLIENYFNTPDYDTIFTMDEAKASLRGWDSYDFHKASDKISNELLGLSGDDMWYGPNSEMARKKRMEDPNYVKKVRGKDKKTRKNEIKTNKLIEKYLLKAKDRKDLAIKVGRVFGTIKKRFQTEEDFIKENANQVSLLLIKEVKRNEEFVFSPKENKKKFILDFINEKTKVQVTDKYIELVFAGLVANGIFDLHKINSFLEEYAPEKSYFSSILRYSEDGCFSSFFDLFWDIFDTAKEKFKIGKTKDLENYNINKASFFTAYNEIINVVSDDFIDIYYYSDIETIIREVRKRCINFELICRILYALSLNREIRKNTNSVKNTIKNLKDKLLSKETQKALKFKFIKKGTKGEELPELNSNFCKMVREEFFYNLA